MKTLIAACAVTAAAVSLAGPALANPVPPAPTVVVSHDNGLRVGASWNGQPVVGVTSDERGVCAGISLQMGHCVPVQLQGP